MNIKLKGPKLVPKQWKLLATAFSNIAQAVLVFSLAALFIPDAVSLPANFPKIEALSFIFSGLILLSGCVIISKKGN